MRHTDAIEALRQLDGKPALATSIPLAAQFDTSMAPNLKATNVVGDTVIIHWKRPIPKVRLYYRSPRDARQAVDIVNRQLFRNGRLKGTLRDSRQVVIVHGFASQTLTPKDVQEVGNRYKPDSDPVLLEDYYDHNEAIDTMTNFVKAVPDLRRFDVTESTDGKSVTVFVNFHDNAGATAFLHDLGKLTQNL
jgi:hypothetical protein